MTITLATRTTFAVPSSDVELLVTASDPTATLVRLFVTAAPAGSTLRAQLDETTATEVEVTPTGSGGGWDLARPTTHRLPLTAGGVFTFKAQEIRKGAANGYGGGYAGDPVGLPIENLLGENTVTVEVGTRLSCPIGVPTYGTATLIVWVWGDFIRATNVGQQGEDTPAIAGAVGQGAILAAEDSAVLTALAALDGYDVTTLSGELTALSTAFKTVISAHFRDATAHAAADSDNFGFIDNLPTGPTTPEGWAQSAQIVMQRLRLHMTNTTDNLPFGAKRYHEAGGIALPDTINLPVAFGSPLAPGQMAGVLAGFADAHRAYEDHRVDAVHASPDVINILPALGALLQLHGLFLQRSADLSAGPAAVPAGVQQAISAAGFSPSPI